MANVDEIQAQIRLMEEQKKALERNIEALKKDREAAHELEIRQEALKLLTECHSPARVHRWVVRTLVTVVEAPTRNGVWPSRGFYTVSGIRFGRQEHQASYVCTNCGTGIKLDTAG